eukprot:3980459-Ditylum_brightwellii.AAC.1
MSSPDTPEAPVDHDAERRLASERRAGPASRAPFPGCLAYDHRTIHQQEQSTARHYDRSTPTR